jgi:hypothetical protein
MNRIHPIRRVTGVLAGLAGAWLGLAVAAPAGFAIGPSSPVRPGATSSRRLSRAGTCTRRCHMGTAPGPPVLSEHRSRPRQGRKLCTAM